MPTPPDKPGSRHSPTPSVQSGDLLNALLIIKDTINTTLLKEHTRLNDLANVLLELEDQIRDVFEETIKGMKAEVEKRRRKIHPGIKKLQDALKSLTKSESKIKGSDKGGKNSDVKKAKLRIREAQRIIKELGINCTEFSVSAFVADQVTVLCKRLMRVPPRLTMYETPLNTGDQNIDEKSDTDSDDGRKSTEETNNIYAEIDQYQTEDTYLLPKAGIASQQKNSHDTQTIGKESSSQCSLLKYPQSPRLENVDLFSSDSDSLEEDLKKSQNLTFQLYQPRSRNPVVHDPEVSEKRHRTSRFDAANKYHMYSPETNDNVSLDRLQRRENAKGNETYKRHRSNSNPTSVTKSQEFRKYGESCLSPSMIQHVGRFQKPIHDDVKRIPQSVVSNKSISVVSPVHSSEFNSRPCTSSSNNKDGTPTYLEKSILKSSADRKNQNSNCRLTKTFLPSARSPTKRYLPPIPKEHEEPPGDSTREPAKALPECVTTGQVREIDHTKNQKYNQDTNLICQAQRPVEKGVSVRNSQSDTDNVDMEELKFRESVRSARREIIAKLKSKYKQNVEENEVLEAEIKVPCYSDFKEKINMHSSIISDNTSDERPRRETKHHRRYSLDAGNKSQYDSHRPSNTFSPISKPTTTGTYMATAIKITPGDESILTHPLNSRQSASRESIVASNIKKFETEILKKEISDLRPSLATETRTSAPMRRKDQHVRYRSSSEPRTTLKSITYFQGNYRNSNLSSPKALQPRRSNGISTISRIDRDKETNPTAVLDQNHVLKVSCTENDLRNLVRNESPSSIRRQWSMRRSQSLNPKIHERNTATKAPKFIFKASFQLPSLHDRCQVSAMVALDNGSIVALDERNFFLHVFDETYKHTHQQRLYDIPRGCEMISDNRIVVGLPYKRSLQFYTLISSSRLRLDKEITIPCNHWIIDFSFAQTHLHVLCKAGHMHLLNEDGNELSHLPIGMTGNIFIHPVRKRFFLLGERHLAKFDMEGKLLSTDTNIDARAMLFFENRIYFAERQRHRITPLGDCVDVPDLIEDKIEFPLAMCISNKADLLFVSQYDENLDTVKTRTITVYKQNKAL